MIYEFNDKKYNNEQEIIHDGVQVIYYYCYVVKGRWMDIECLMIEDGWYGFLYARDVICGRYDQDIEVLYLMRHSRKWADWYIDELVRYGNV